MNWNGSVNDAILYLSDIFAFAIVWSCDDRSLWSFSTNSQYFYVYGIWCQLYKLLAASENRIPISNDLYNEPVCTLCTLFPSVIWFHQIETS